MQIDVEALRALLVVVEQGSITDAARILHLSRSAVSWRMKRLEEHVGQELILRDGRSIRPSRAARAILDDARTIVETHDRITRSLSNADLTGEVTVGADGDVDVSRLTGLLGSFRRVHPGVDVNLMVDRSWTVLAGLDRGDVDLGILQVAVEDLEPDDRVLWTDSLVWVTGRGDRHEPDPGGRVVPLITYGPECPWRALSEPMLRDAGIDHRVALSVPNTGGVVSSVADGLGIGVIPRRSITDRLRPWSPAEGFDPFPEVAGVLRVGGHGRSATVEALADLLATELAPAESVVGAVAGPGVRAGAGTRGG